MSRGGGETRALAAAALREAAGGGAPAAAELRVLDGPLAGCRLPLGGEETLGRGAAATLRLTDPGASRVHLRLRLASGGVAVDDLHSKNGWLLNGRRRRRERLLRHGDVLGVGGTRLRLELPQGGSAGPGGTGASAPPPGAPPGRRAAAAAAALLALAAAAAGLAMGGG